MDYYTLVGHTIAMRFVLSWTTFSSKSYGPRLVVRANHPCYRVEAAHGRYLRQNVPIRRLLIFHPRLLSTVTLVEQRVELEQ